MKKKELRDKLREIALVINNTIENSKKDKQELSEFDKGVAFGIVTILNTLNSEFKL